MMCCQLCIVIDCRTDAAAFPHRPIMMTKPSNSHRNSVLHRLAGWWRSRCNPRFGGPSSVHVADEGEAAARRNASLNEAKPRTLAGKWPDAANSLKLVHLRCDAVDMAAAGRPAAVP
jgi:hypothetical protein